MSYYFFFSVMTNDISNSKSLYVHIFCVLTRHQTLLCIRDSGTFTYVVVSREISLSVGYTFCYVSRCTSVYSNNSLTKKNENSLRVTSELLRKGKWIQDLLLDIYGRSN